MTLIIPNAAEEVFLDAILSTNYTLRLFTNDPVAGLTPSQVEALDETDFTEATFPGYAGAALSGGTWTTTQGDDRSVGTYTQQTFTRSSTGAPEVIRGYYVVRTTGGLLRWFEYFPGPLTVEFINDAIAITPTFTLDDDKEATVAARGTVARQSLASSSAAYSTGATTDFVLANVPVDSSRLYKVCLHSVAVSSAGTRWITALFVDGVQVDVLNDTEPDTTNLVYSADGHLLWEPATGTPDLDLRLSAIGGGTVQFLATVGNRVRQFWVEDVGPR